MTEKMNANYENNDKTRESNTDRLKTIIEEPQLRTLFREFLRSNFCEENLSFWLDVEDFKRKFNITSSAIAVAPVSRTGAKITPGQAAMERHHESLIQKAFEIYNNYLAPSSPCELNIDHGLRNELSGYLSDVIQTITGKSLVGRVELEQANAFNATQLQTMIKLYGRIQTHVFRLMATDSVPKVFQLFIRLFGRLPICLQFIKTPRFLDLKIKLNDEDEPPIDDYITGSLSAPPGLNDEEVGRAYVTISQKALALSEMQGTTPPS